MLKSLWKPSLKTSLLRCLQRQAVIQPASLSARAHHFQAWSDADAPVILAAKRTPIGSFQGSLASLSAPDLGSVAIRAALDEAGVDGEMVDEAIVGNVVSANVGQAPARQAVVKAGLGWHVPCTTINKVCSSGMKAIMMAAQGVLTGQNHVVIAGGMESMSQVPYYLPAARGGLRYGHGEVVDGVLRDGLWDAFDDHHMGMCAEHCASEFDFSREEQDAFAIESYNRAAAAWKAGKFDSEVVQVPVPQRRGDPVMATSDDEVSNVKLDKLSKLRPAFKSDGTVTAANASSLNDGACAVIVASAAFAKEHNLKPLARIKGFADAAQEPVQFTTAPAKAIPLAMKNAGVSADDVDFYEINEAFSVVALANNRLLGLDAAKVNPWGGAVALGHPIGCSGARIVTTLLNVLRAEDGTIGVAGICNGGGGASSIVIERLD